MKSTRAPGPIRRLLSAAAILGAASSSQGRGTAAIPGPPNWAAHYQRVWAQDFSTMSRLAQLGVSARQIGAGAWIAHTPGSTDWFTFQDPTANFHPFGVGNGYLTIRVQKDGHDPNHWFGGYSGGLLSSMDGQGKGFAQEYGYFECSMWTPGGPNTWPAFWVLDAPSVTQHDLSAAEIDVTESYGNWGTGPRQKPPGDPDEDSVTWHLWGKNGQPTRANGSFVREPAMTTGFHTYGVDIEPTGITWYFDRKRIWWAPIYPEAERPMYVLLNLALGGGNHNNAAGDNYDWALTPDPSDLKVKYVAVWASPASPNYTGPPEPPVSLRALPGNRTIELKWDTALGASSYSVERDRKLLASNLTGTVFVDRTAANSRPYTYQVVAVGGKGKSAAAEVRATAKFGPPMRPGGLAAAPAHEQVTLSWAASPDAASYNVCRGVAAGAESQKSLARHVHGTSYVDTNVRDGQPYFYTVAAVSTGGISRTSNEADAIPAESAEAAVVNYAATTPATGNRAVWNRSPAFAIARLGLGEPTSTHAVFQVLWDPAALYYLFTVNDRSLVHGAPNYNGDAVEIYLDALNSKRTVYDTSDFRYTLGYGYSVPTEPAHSATAGVLSNQQKYPGGYRVQITIPWRTLGVTPFAGMSVGMDAAIDDATSGVRGRTSALFWYDNDATDWQNPGRFGNAILQPPSVHALPAAGVYRVVNVNSGEALTVPGGSAANVALDQAPWAGGANQQWRLLPFSSGIFALQNVKSGSVVDCSPTFDVGGRVVQWPINGTPSATQRFLLTTLGNQYLLMNVYSGRVLDVTNASKAENTPVTQSLSTAAPSQLWDLVPLDRQRL